MSLPTPDEYGRMDQAQRGEVCAALTGSQIRDFADSYAAHLEALSGVPVDRNGVIARMFLVALLWRGRECCNVARD